MSKQPDRFDGSHESWSDWSFQFMSYVSALDRRTADIMNAAVNTEQALTMTGAEEDLKRSRTLFYMLTLFTSIRSKAFKKLKNVKMDNGFEAWRQVISEYEPRTRGRHGVMLDNILTVSFPSGAALLPKLESWEREVQEYEEQTADALQDSIKMNVLIRAQEDHALKGHLTLNAARLTTYSLMKAEIVGIVSNQREWKSANTDGVIPMQVDAFKGKDGSKGKKGKYGKKGKDKGKDGKGGKGPSWRPEDCTY